MKGKIKNIAYILIFIILMFVFAPKSQAAGLVIAFSKSTANVGDNVTVTVTGSGIAGRVNLSVSGNATLSQSSVWVDNNSASVTANIKGEGSIKITATAADMSDSTTAAPYTGATAGTITVKSSSSSSGSSSSGNDSSSGINESTSNTKSSNANLSNLGIRPNDFSGFSPNKTSYSVTVPNDVTTVEIYANKGQSGQKISGTGSKTLQEGSNTYKIVVTAEDGKTQKTYTLTINRQAGENKDQENSEEVENTENTENTNENTENEEEIKFGLKELSIEGVTLSPEFQTGVYEYTTKLIGEANNLNIKATATDEKAKVEITGNENLQEGENTVTILVTNENGDETVAYQIKVTKSLVDEEAIAKQKEIEEQEKQRKMILIGAGIAAVLIILIVIILYRKRSKRLAEEYTIPFMNMNQDDENENDYEDKESYQKVTDKFLNKNIQEDKEQNQDNQVSENTLEDKTKSNIENNFDDDSEKAKLRREYLNQTFDNMNDFDAKPIRKKHSKGKRFKK